MSRRDFGRLAVALTIASATPHRVGAEQAETITTGNPALIDWNRIEPGSEIVISSGTYRWPMLIKAKATAERPIVIRAEKPDGARFRNSIIFEDGAQHVILRDILIEGARHSGVIIRHRASNIRVENVTVQDSGLGIWIGDKAGDGHRLVGNRLLRNQTHGIAIDELNARHGHETVIEGNLLIDNAMHGMEIDGSHYIVLRNRVHGSGHGLSGCSGIHTFCRTPDRPFGKSNVIAFNTVSGTRESTGQDGNGIQADEWCDDNLIAFNICFANDGAGVNLYNASRTGVYHNTLIDNIRDSGGRHVYPTEILLASDFTRDMQRPRANRILNNIAVATNPSGVAFYAEATGATLPHEIGNNLFFHAGGGDLAFWGPTDWRGRDLEDWNAATGGADDFAGDPRFVDPENPETGLRPEQGSPALEIVPLPVDPLQDRRDLFADSLSPDHLGALPADE